MILSDLILKEVLEADNRRCRMCGSANDLIQHHIVYQSESDAQATWLHQRHNLITLCNNPCHDLIHSNKSLYQPLCRQIAWLRDVRQDRETLITHLSHLPN
jgi:predicted restriction endonuclease